MAGGASLCVDIEAYKQYTELQNKLQAVEQQTKSLAATPQVCYYQLVMKECALSTGNLRVATCQGKVREF